jgi:hypothetical protein
MPERWFEGNRLVAGDLLEFEGWYFIEEFEVCADFLVEWRHPADGVSGIYMSGGCGFGDGFCEFGPEHLAMLVESTLLDDAERDFAHDGAYFARDLRIAPVRDTTDAETYAALRAGPPYPRQCGRILHPAGPLPPEVGVEPGWRQVLPPPSDGIGGEPILVIREGDPLPPGWCEVG